MSLKQNASPTPSASPLAPRPSPLRMLPTFVFLGLLLSYGVAEGLWTNRWFASAGLEQATARLARVPRVVGDWEGTDQELDAQTIAVAELSGYVMRRYVNRRTGVAISMLLVCGRPGPTAQHTPEICYVGAGFHAKEAPVHATISIPPPLTKGGPGGVIADKSTDEKPAEFWLAHYIKGGPSPEALRIYWAWNASGTWQASARPRLEFAPRAALYKLYVVRQLSKANEPLTDEPAAQFLEVFLPMVRQALFGTADDSPRASGHLSLTYLCHHGVARPEVLRRACLAADPRPSEYVRACHPAVFSRPSPLAPRPSTYGAT